MNLVIVAALTLVALAGTAVVLTRPPARQAVTYSFFGLALTVLFLILQAPDVALSQLGVGTAVVPLMVMLAIRTMRARERQKEGQEPGRGRPVSRRVRMIVFLAGAAGLAVMLGAAFARMPAFGAAVHLDRTLAVRDAVARRTANVVSSVNFDLRGLDTLGEETILIASVVGAAVLLRPAEGEGRRQPRSTGRTLESTRLLGYLLLPVTLIIGFDLVAHGHLTPGGGFQGGVVIATGMFLLYVTDSYQALGLAPPGPRLRGRRGPRRGRLRRRGPGRAGHHRRVPRQHHQPEGDVRPVFLRGDGAGPHAVVGLEVGCGMVVLITHFLEQDIAVTGTVVAR